MGNLNMLPVDIIFNILTRLPAESVVDFKLVSKAWNDVFKYESFSQSLSNQCINNPDSGAGKFTFLLVNENPSYRYRLFHYLEFHDEVSSTEKPRHRVRRMKLNPAPIVFYNIVGSCNGLVCLKGCHDHEWINYEPFYICNPITRECVFLPKFERKDGRCDRFVTGFGHVSVTDEYKIVRMFNLLTEANSLLVEVYTLGSGKGWRNIGKKIDYDPYSFNSIPGVFVNGSLYWKLRNGRILAFDLAKEIFVELPKCSFTDRNFRLGVLGGCLLAGYYDIDSKKSDIFLLQKKEDGSLDWVKELSLSNTDTEEIVLDWLVLTGRRTVLCRSKTKVLIHDLNSSSSDILVDFGKDKAIFQTVPHTNTLVSLRALGEENTETMEAVDVPEEVSRGLVLPNV